MEDEDGPLLRRQAPEATVEGVAIDHVLGRVATAGPSAGSARTLAVQVRARRASA